MSSFISEALSQRGECAIVFLGDGVRLSGQRLAPTAATLMAPTLHRVHR